MEEFPASKVYLQPATWLTGKFPNRRISWHFTGQFGCGHRSKYRPSVVIGGRGGGVLWQITHTSYSRHQIPSDTLNYLFPISTHIIFSHVSQPANIWLKYRYFEGQILWVSLWGEWRGDALNFLAASPPKLLHEQKQFLQLRRLILSVQFFAKSWLPSCNFKQEVCYQPDSSDKQSLPGLFPLQNRFVCQTPSNRYFSRICCTWFQCSFHRNTRHRTEQRNIHSLCPGPLEHTG